MKKINLIYWIITGILAALFLMSSVMYLTSNEGIVQGFKAMGYPMFLIPLLGVAKLLGAVGILQTRFPLLKEWAYAGLTINLVGAVWSHIAVGDAFTAPLVFLLLVATSYWLYHRKAAFQKNWQLQA